MTKRNKLVGYNAGGNPGSDQWLSPHQPYTGDGQHRRSFIDGVIQVVFKPARLPAPRGPGGR